MFWYVLICIAIFCLYLLFKLLIAPKLEAKKSVMLITAIDLLFIVLIIPVSFKLLEPVLYKDRIQRDDNFKQQVLSGLDKYGVDIEGYQKRLAELYKLEYDSSSEDAEEWASNFLATHKIRRDKLKYKKEEEIREKKKELAKLPVLFDFILHDFDSQVLAFQKRFPKTEFDFVKDYDLMVDLDLGGERGSMLVRRVVFENGSQIELFLQQGSSKEGLVESYPAISCQEITKNLKDQDVSFKIERSTGGIRIGGARLISDISYSLEGDSFVSEDFRSGISAAFQKAIETVYLR